MDVLLFEIRDPWLDHWRGMPEYSHEDLTPVRSLIVNFESEADVEKFARLVGQQFGPSVRSIWFPEAEIGRFADKRYSDAV